MRVLPFLLIVWTGCAQSWVRYSDPLGFSVEHPLGWRVRADSSGLVKVASPDGSAFVAVQPFLVDRPTTARAWLPLSLGQLADLFPGARVARIEQRPGRTDEVLASIAYSGGGQATALCFIGGRAGMFYAVAAPQAQFAARRAELVRVLSTFRYQPPAAPREEYVRWRDPLENAFSFEVPRGWTVKGGMHRFAPVDTRAAAEAVSPDGRIRITSGDAGVPPFTEPNQMLAMAGFREGSWYSPGYGVRMMVRRYVPGVAFAAEYAQRQVSAHCPGVRILDSKDRPDLARLLGQIYSQGGFVTQQLTVGEAAFTCGDGMRGLYFAGTLSTRFQGSGLWHVQHLGGYVAPAGRLAEADAVFKHLLTSIEVNPEWARMQQGVTAASSRIVAQTHAEISAGMSQTYWNRQRSQDNLSRKWSNVILGQTDVVDPATGEKWKVASGSNYYWRKEGADVITGTDTWTRPNIDFTPLQEW